MNNAAENKKHRIQGCELLSSAQITATENWELIKDLPTYVKLFHNFYYSYHTQLHNPRYILQIGSWESVSTPLLLEYFSRSFFSKGLPDSHCTAFIWKDSTVIQNPVSIFQLLGQQETTCRRYLGWSYRTFKAIVIYLWVTLLLKRLLVGVTDDAIFLRRSNNLLCETEWALMVDLLVQCSTSNSSSVAQLNTVKFTHAQEILDKKTKKDGLNNISTL